MIAALACLTASSTFRSDRQLVPWIKLVEVFTVIVIYLPSRSGKIVSALIVCTKVAGGKGSAL